MPVEPRHRLVAQSSAEISGPPPSREGKALICQSTVVEISKSLLFCGGECFSPGGWRAAANGRKLVLATRVDLVTEDALRPALREAVERDAVRVA